MQRYKDRLSRISQIKLFLKEARPLAENTYDGILLGDALLEVESKLRTNFPKEDVKQQEVFDELRSQLLFVKSRFTKSLDANTAPKISKKGMIKSTAGGLAGAFILMLLVLLGQKVWTNAKSNGKAAFNDR